jgi:hypothetical protein
MRLVELIGGPKDGEKVGVPTGKRQVTIPVRISSRNGTIRYLRATYSERQGKPRVFDFRGEG